MEARVCESLPLLSISGRRGLRNVVKNEEGLGLGLLSWFLLCCVELLIYHEVL